MAALVTGIPHGAAEFDALCSDLWNAEVTADDGIYRRRCVQLLNEFQACLESFDYRKGAVVLLAFHFGRGMAVNSAQLNAHYKASIASAVEVASQAVNLRRFLSAYQLAAEIRESLAECYRTMEDVSSSPFFLRVRSLVLWILAECKWQDVSANRDLLLSPEDLYLEFRLLFTNVVDNLMDNQDRGQALKNTAYFLLNTEFALLRLATRFHPEMVPELVAQFNERYGGCLQPELWHFRDNPTSRGETANYWHYEIAKLYIAGELTTGLLDFCYGQLLKNLTIVEQESQAHRWSLEQYYKYLKRTTQLQLFEFQDNRL
jgi:hypothetical protein